MRHIVASVVVATVVLVLISLRYEVALAQQALTSFEAASVKRNNSGTPGVTTNYPPGRYVVVNAPVCTLLLFAFSGEIAEILDAPDWASSERYDINATAGREVDRAELRGMVKRLLAERFGFTFDVETRERPVYIFFG